MKSKVFDLNFLDLYFTDFSKQRKHIGEDSGT